MNPSWTNPPLLRSYRAHQLPQLHQLKICPRFHAPPYGANNAFRNPFLKSQQRTLSFVKCKPEVQEFSASSKVWRRPDARVAHSEPENTPLGIPGKA